MSTPAFAADTAAGSEDLQEVVITGSILRRTDAETPSPVTVLTAEDLQQRGINTVAEALQRLSANGSGAIGQGWNNGSNFATGANAVSLRGLTVQSTLTIFDGLRMAPYPLADDGHRNFVDLNTLPDAVVEKIDIVKDGASSTYGADAIAGVVNVITKKEVTGLHFDVSGGAGVRGGGTERRLDATWGTGKLDEQGYNFYITGEYQKDDAIRTSSRQYPYNTADLSGVCDGAGHCLSNGVQFGINNNGTLGAGTTTTAALVAPSSATGARAAGNLYRLLNTAAGCNVEPGLTPVTLTAAQGGTTYALSQCQQDLRAQYQTLQPQQERHGLMSRYTMKFGSNSEFYATGSWYDVKTATQLTPLAFNTSTTAPRVVTLNPVLLPIYVCGSGVGTINAAGVNISTGCTAANGFLNPNNPFASIGGNAIVRVRYDRPRTELSDARSLRGAAGVTGTFGDGNKWNYSADFTASQVRLNINYRNFMIPQRIADVVAQGTYNFVDQTLNSEAIRNYIAPDDVNISDSRMTQAQAVLGRSLFTLPGGDVQAAVGVSYRKESITNPSANPDNVAAPYNRFYNVNAVGATGSRDVKSAFFEIGAPIVKSFEADLSGRYDKYSSGQTNFSPKLGVKFKPIEQLALRSTYSRGFRIPSFNESYGLPTTGFSTSQVTCASAGTFCAQHNNNSYATAAYSLGTTATGNPALNPEKSRSYTFGIVVEPIENVSFTVDYWNIEVKDLVSQVSATDRTAAQNQYYQNNGVVNIPGITVTPGVSDPAFPNALPLLGTINYSYNNADKENVSGIDFGLSISRPLGDSLKWSSTVDASLLQNYTITRKNGDIERYAGTLSPCDYTSCSGSPKWRGSWSNSLSFGDATITGTAYYTGGYKLAEVDYGGNADNCQANDGTDGAPFFVGTTIQSACTAKAQWNFDLNGRYKFNDKLTGYIDALNVFNIAPVRDPAAAYALTQYNPAWGQANIIGRYFRVGLKADF